MKINVCAVFDIGKTNKKLFLFNEDYQIVWEKTTFLDEVCDEDGFPCEDLQSLRTWVGNSFEEINKTDKFDIKALNFSAYGASFVHLSEDGKPITPLYNYLKPFDENLKKQFYNNYGGEESICTITASPALGNLNSGLQLYSLKYLKPEIYDKIKYSLHLPQYLSFLFSNQYYSDFTSVGCHTKLWNFSKMKYHEWTTIENLDVKLAPLHYSNYPVKVENLVIGTGLHDSSSAIIPYLLSFSEPFVLLSTGTWCITLNPFNNEPLTVEELKNDCLCFLTFDEKSIKSSRLFAGNEHEIQLKRLSEHFKVDISKFLIIEYDSTIIDVIKSNSEQNTSDEYSILQVLPFKNRDLKGFKSYIHAYHQLIFDLVSQQLISTNLVLQGSPVRRLFVDGGFSKNDIFMNLLAEAFPEIEIYSAQVAQASALGAAVVIHNSWNTKAIPQDIISLKKY